MADGELWLTRDQALARFQRVLKLSVGAAEAAFDQAMSSGTIRSRALRVLLIEPSTKRDVYYDHLDSGAWQRGNHGSINGEVSSDDLEFWVTQKLAIPRAVDKPADKPQRARRGKRAAAKDAVAACYPDGIPDDVQNGPLCTTIVNWLKKEKPNMPKMDNITILRASGRAK